MWNRGDFMVGHYDADSPELSIIIPAHNEAGRILPYLRQITDYFRTHERRYELLVVDDGSTDTTAAVVEGFARFAPAVRLLRLATCQGKGAAVRHGMQSAAGYLQLFADADGATPIEEVSRLEKALAEGADVAIGSRALAARVPDFAVHARLYRSLLGMLFNAAVQQSGIRGISDTQCGFKLFRRIVAQELFGYASIDGFGFDLELLYLAQQRGYRIAEVPVNWTDQPGSKVRVLRDGYAMLRDLAVIRRNSSRGCYSIPSFSPELFSVGAGRLRVPAR
jgi:dolichyl-phosphate beta-glucosyltransferase